jgi:hypothetical protein
MASQDSPACRAPRTRADSVRLTSFCNSATACKASAGPMPSIDPTSVFIRSTGGQVTQGDRAVPLGQPPGAVGIHHQWNVRIFRNRHIQKRGQICLPGRGRQEVVAADHLVYALLGIIHDDGQVVRGHAVVPAQDKVIHHSGECPCSTSSTVHSAAEERSRMAAGRVDRLNSSSAAESFCRCRDTRPGARAARRVPPGSHGACRSIRRSARPRPALRWPPCTAARGPSAAPPHRPRSLRRRPGPAAARPRPRPAHGRGPRPAAGTASGGTGKEPGQDCRPEVSHMELTGRAGGEAASASHAIQPMPNTTRAPQLPHSGRWPGIGGSGALAVPVLMGTAFKTEALAERRMREQVSISGCLLAGSVVQGAGWCAGSL